MRNQCICLTCYKQHEKAISRGTGPNRVHNQKQHHKSTGATEISPAPPALSAGESSLTTRSVGKRIKNNIPEAWTSIRDWWKLWRTSQKKTNTCMHTANACIYACVAWYILQRLKHSVTKRVADHQRSSWISTYYYLPVLLSSWFFDAFSCSELPGIILSINFTKAIYTLSLYLTCHSSQAFTSDVKWNERMN